MPRSQAENTEKKNQKERRVMSQTDEYEYRYGNRKRRSAKPGFPEGKPADSMGGWYHCTGCRRKDGL